MNARRISIVICTHGERFQALQRLVHALDRQSSEFELIVVSGQASDPLRRTVAGLADRARVVECPAPNISLARNLGIRAAGGDLVVFIDDDAVPAHREWLLRLTAPLTEGGRIAATGGPVISGFSYLVEFGGGASSAAGFQRAGPSGDAAASPDGSAWVPRVPGGNAAFLVAALREIGGFDEQYAYYLDEVDVCLRLAAKGYEIVSVESAEILHYPGPSVHGPAHLRSRRLVARSDAYFVMRHTSGRKARRAWLAVKYLPVKPYFRLGRARRKAKTFSVADLIRFQAECAAGLAAGIWAGRGAGAMTMAAAQGAAPAWQPWPRASESRGAVTVTASFRSMDDWNGAVAAGNALSRAGYEVAVISGFDLLSSKPPKGSFRPPEFDCARDVWDAANIALRLSRLAREPHAAAAVAEVSIGRELVARLRTALVPRVVHAEAERSPEPPASSPLGQWLCAGSMAGRVFVVSPAAEAAPNVEWLLATDGGVAGESLRGAPDEIRLIAAAWSARLRGDLARDSGTTPWPLRMKHLWALAMLLIRHCLDGEPKVAFELASAYGTHLAVADPGRAAEFDYQAARALRTLERGDEAAPFYERIVAAGRTGVVRSPFHAGACYHLAVAACAAGRTSQAVELLTECLRVQPDHGAARRLLEELRPSGAAA